MRRKNRMMLQQTLIVAADLSKVVAFQPSMTSMGSFRLDCEASLENVWQHAAESERPTLTASGPRTASMVHNLDANRPGSAAELERRFAREAGAWIAMQMTNARAARVVVFAPPRFLGLLRETLPADVDADLQHGEFTQLSAAEFARHPAMLGLLGAGGRT
ncbi:MAG: host attachment protein [Phycisphaerales bacterium]